MMNEMMKSMGVSEEEAGIVVENVIISMTLYDFDKVDNIKIPAEAKAAT